MVTRTVLGLRDESLEGYYNHGDEIYDDITVWTQIGSGNLDGEPDIFNFNFNGYSGKFIIDSNHEPVLIPKQDLMVQWDFNHSSEEFRRFTIITPDGTKYHFGNIMGSTSNNGIEVTKLKDAQGVPEQLSDNYNSSWYLVRIESSDGKWLINLEYEEELYGISYPATCSEYFAYCVTLGGEGSSNSYDCSGKLDTEIQRYINRESIEGVRLSRITTSSGAQVVDFIEGDIRQDLGNSYDATDNSNTGRWLKEIQVASGSFCSKWEFSYDYFKDLGNSTRPEYKRLRLNQLQQKTCLTSPETIPAHIFYYEGANNNDGSAFFPNRLSRAIDHWGYYNGANDNNTLTSATILNIPPTTIIDNTGQNIVKGTAGVDREAHFAYAKYGMLKQVKYPTGGSTYFTFESNKGRVKTYTTDFNAGLTNCDLVNSDCCLSGNLQETVDVVLTQNNIDFAQFSLELRAVNTLDPIHCGAGCPCTGTQASMTLTAYDLTTSTAVGSFQFNLTIPTQMVYSYNELPLSTLEVSNYFVSGHNYRFTMTTQNGKGTFTMWTSYGANTGPEIEVGGLRVKEIRTSEKSTQSLNDIIRTYDYVQESDPTKTSGELFFRPIYGYFHGATSPTSDAYTYTYRDASIVSLGTFEGHHVGYARVIENQNGNGKKVMKFKTIYFPMPNRIPHAPPLAAVNNGSLEMEQAMDATGVVKSLINNLPASIKYKNSEGNAIKVTRTTPLDICGNAIALYHSAAYRPRTAAYQVSSTTMMLDGVSTTTNLYYDPAKKHLQTVRSDYFNSDGKKMTTKYSYPTTLGFQCLRDDLMSRNMIATPTSTKHYVDDVLVAGDSTRWSSWSPTSGLPNQTCNNTNLPYPWEFYSYEMTYDASGNAITGTWVRKGLIDERYTTAQSKGLIKKFTQTCGADNTCWKPEFYEWSPSGLITKRTYNNDASAYKNFVTQYEYYPNGVTANGSRLLKKITNIDGQYTEFEYDALMRLWKTSARKVGATINVLTEYTYGYGVPSAGINYVKSKTTYTDMTTSGSAFKEKTLWQYLDGLGRPIQTVDQQHSPTSKDVVVIMEYDNQGRQSKVYEPFEQNQTTGAYVATVPGGTPYTLNEYYSDPLNRPWKMTPPSWNYPTIYSYGTNLASNVKLNHTTNTWYPANSLYLTTVEDPNGNRSFTFKDKKGRLILSRRRNNSGTLEANTFNLYDNKDRLTTVIPPDATIANADLIFKYLYDATDNMIMKDVPDAAAMNMKYNTRDLMALMQDGNLLAAPNKWLATEYDVYGRPTKMGFVTTASPNPNSFTIVTADVLTETTYDDVATSQAIYKGKVKQSKVKILDGGTTFITTDYTYDAHGRVSNTAANNFTGGSDNYVFTYDWADNRLTSARTHKRLSTDAATTILETNTYDHAGRIKLNKHKLGTGTEVTLSQLNYNAKDELIEKNLGYVSPTSTLQSLDYSYNAQGWLTAINQATLVPSGIIGGVTVPLAACPTAPTSPTPGVGTTPDDNDMFYLELKYDGQFTGMTGDTIQKNGNINQLMWRTRGRERQAYNFNYDFLDRLLSARYADVSDVGTVTTNSRYNESLGYADHRGNINTLKRQGAQLSGSCWNFSQIDNLTYTYYTGTNKLKRIWDASSNNAGFKPNNTVSTDYVYDPSGNMKDDPFKGMAVLYNHLNLPNKFTFAGSPTKTVDILYDAAGTKLRKTVKTSTTTNYMQDYIGGIEYRDGVREAIYTSEGRVKYTSPTVTRYEYSVKDHLGNSRISITDLNANGVVNVTSTPATNEILQENHYYSFGLNTEGPWMNDAALDNKYQYNGKEWNDDFGLNWNNYGMRWYMPDAPRFGQIDPASEKYPSISGYNYVANNPINFFDPRGDTLRAVNHISAERALELIQSGIPTPSSAYNLFTLASDGVTFNSISTEKLSNSLKGLNVDQAALVIGYSRMINGSETNVVEIVNRNETISKYGQEVLELL